MLLLKKRIHILNMNIPIRHEINYLSIIKNYTVLFILLKFMRPDFAEPLVLPGATATKAKAAFVPDEEGVGMVMGMGFSRDQAIRALKETVGLYRGERGKCRDIHDLLIRSQVEG